MASLGGCGLEPEAEAALPGPISLALPAPAEVIPGPLPGLAGEPPATAIPEQERSLTNVEPDATLIPQQEGPVTKQPQSACEEEAPPVAPPSEGAIYKRLNRAMKPREDGSYIIPESIRLEWHDKSQRAGVFRLFERCAYDNGHGSEFRLAFC